MTEMYCEKCGNAVQPKDRFCRKCGSPLGSKNVVVEHAKPETPVKKRSSQSPPPVSPDLQQAGNDEQQFLKSQIETEKRENIKGTPFKTGLLIGGAKGFAFMFVVGAITIPILLGTGHSTSFTCIMFLLAVGAAYGAGQWANHFAKAKGLAPSSVVGEGIGGVIGGLIGAVIFSIIMVSAALSIFRNP